MKNPTPKQKEKAEKKRNAFRELFNLVKNLTPEERSKYSEIAPILTIEGHVLSGTNQILIAMQFQDATIVGGFRQWRKANRTVKKGETAISIWIPSKKSTEDDETTDDEVKFFMGNVFDITQTTQKDKTP